MLIQLSRLPVVPHIWTHQGAMMFPCASVETSAITLKVGSADENVCWPSCMVNKKPAHCPRLYLTNKSASDPYWRQEAR